MDAGKLQRFFLSDKSSIMKKTIKAKLTGKKMTVDQLFNTCKISIKTKSGVLTICLLKSEVDEVIEAMEAVNTAIINENY